MEVRVFSSDCRSYRSEKMLRQIFDDLKTS